MLKLFARQRPGIRGDWFGYVDGGGTYTRVGIGDHKTGKEVFLKKFRSGKFKSLEDIIETAFTQVHGVPATMVYAVAGPNDKEHRQVSLTNRPEWPAFKIDEIRTNTGSRGLLFNDVELLAAGASTSDADQLVAVREGHRWKAGRIMALTWSTGINGALFEHRRTLSLETGYGKAIPALTDDEKSFSKFVAKKLGVPYANAEQLLGGGHGQAYAPEWLMQLGDAPSEATKERFAQLEQEGVTSYGPALTAGLADDPFCQRIMRALGGLYGTYVRQLLVEYMPTGGLHLAGSVHDTTIMMLAQPRYSPMMERISDNRLAYAEVTDGLAIVLNRDPGLMRKGAHILARQ